MENNRKILQGQKVLAIEDQNVGKNMAFINTLERERENAKLYYYMWLSRLFIFLAGVSCLYMVLSSLSLFRLSGLVTIEPYLMINSNNSQEIVRDEPIAVDMASKTQLMETFVKQYILVSNTVIDDPIEMRSRWAPGGMVNFLSLPSVYMDFYKNNYSKLKEYKDIHLTREVEIISINRQGGAKSPLWKVDFKTNDLYNDYGSEGGVQLFKERFWTASVTSYFIPERSFVGRRLINPLGFTVTRFSQSAIDIL